jgi:hypothetical protein
MTATVTSTCSGSSIRPAGRTACRPTRRRAPQRVLQRQRLLGGALAELGLAQHHAGEGNAPSANETPNSTAEPYAMLTAAARRPTA